jgi:transaldolase
MEPSWETLKVKIFADGADFEGMIEMSKKPFITGLTTNPTLMRKAGITNYEDFARKILREITNKSISLEVFSDNLDEMKLQGEKIASWGENVYVKIPITNTQGESTKAVIKYLVEKNVKVNVTAIMTTNQISEIINVLNPKIPSYISIFAGRIADTGRDPLPVMSDAISLLEGNSSAEIIWASPRELLNIFQADQMNCHIITATNDILNKLFLVGKNLNEYSLETVKMFYEDAKKSKYQITVD